MCTAVIDPLTGLYTAIATWDTYNITETVITNMKYSVIVSLYDEYDLQEQLNKTTTIPLLVSEIGLWAFACNLIVVSITIIIIITPIYNLNWHTRSHTPFNFVFELVDTVLNKRPTLLISSSEWEQQLPCSWNSTSWGLACQVQSELLSLLKEELTLYSNVIIMVQLKYVDALKLYVWSPTVQFFYVRVVFLPSLKFSL